MLATQHRDRCFSILGQSYHEVHKYIDRFYAKFSIDHRCILHHRLGIELIGRSLGKDKIPVAELHIKDDTNGVIPENWLFYDEPLPEYIEGIVRKLKKYYGNEIVVWPGYLKKYY